MKYIHVGKTKKTHGIKGGLNLQIEEKFIEDVLNVDVAFLKIQGKLLPYFIEGFEYTNKLIIKFEEVDSPQQANPITSKEFYIRESDVAKKELVINRLDGLTYGKLVGFVIEEEKIGRLGEILEIMEFPQQEMAVIDYNGKEVLIPLNEQLIDAIVTEEKKVKMVLPDGLLDL